MLKDLIRCRGDLQGFALDDDYVAELRRCHGGSPVKQYFQDQRGTLHRCGRFINFHTPATLQGPFQPWFGDPHKDARLVMNRHNLEATANTSEGTGPWLMPFAALYQGGHSPDEMMHDHLDYLCFNHRQTAMRPSVVVWHNEQGVAEAFRCDCEGLDYWDFDEKNCTTPVAESFREFAALLHDAQC